MAARTGIEWTEVTWNPTTGCDRISAGCDNCYALALAKRLKAMGSAKYQRDGDPRTSGPGFGLATHPGALRQPYGWGAPRIVFVNSMRDPSGGAMILKLGSSQVNRYKCSLRHVRQMSRTGGAGR
jgi:protein gp37